MLPGAVAAWLGGQERDPSEDLGLGAAEDSAQGWEEAWLVGETCEKRKTRHFQVGTQTEANHLHCQCVR